MKHDEVQHELPLDDELPVFAQEREFRARPGAGMAEKLRRMRARFGPFPPMTAFLREERVWPAARPEVDARFCEHANECPAVCPCGSGCYCKSHTCRGRR